MPPSYAKVETKIAQIEAEMKRIDFWQAGPLPADQKNSKAAFGGDTMSFPQWLQFVFVPNVRKIITDRGAFPASSSVATRASREFDTSPDDTDALWHLLYEFDNLFG